MRIATTCCLVLLSAACAADDAGRPIATLTATDVAELGIVNGKAPFPGVVTGGQLTEAQVAALAERGYDTLVNLRPAQEEGTGWEEAWAAEHGVSFQRIPIAGVGDLTVDNARRLSGIVDEAQGGVVVYCKSGNRVGALFALEARFLDGQGPEESLRIGKLAGLTRLEPQVRELLQP